MGKPRRKKKHTHVTQDASALPPTPMTFVMERGKVGGTLTQLVLDLRQVMEPYTASKLRVRQRNVLKDFVQVAGPLGVTHFIIISKTEDFINLRICRLPRGPTITFHVKAFCLSREVLSSLRKPVQTLAQFLTPALLVLNNFTTEEQSSKLMTTMLQNMFPSINIQTVKLAEIKRCALFHYDPPTKTLEFRHYNIRAVPKGTSRGVRRLARTHVPNLSKYQDISEYVLGGNVSESEGEDLAGEGEVTLPQDLPGRGNIKSEQSTVRLSELGPRLSLQLVKIESGLCGGEVLHHEFIHKTRHEARKLRKRVEEQRRLRDRRRREQDANVSRKRREREQHKRKSLAGQRHKTSLDDESSGDDNDAEWYRQEVGEEPEPDTFTPGKGPQKRKAKERTFSPKSKKPRLLKQPSRQGKESTGKWKRGRQEDRKGSGHPTSKSEPTSLVKFVSNRSRLKGSRGLPGRGGGVPSRKGSHVPLRRVAGGKVFRKRAKTT